MAKDVKMTVTETTIHSGYVPQVQRDPDGGGERQLDILIPASGRMLCFPMSAETAARLAKELAPGEVATATLLDLPGGARG